jgi:hypothetical protein
VRQLLRKTMIDINPETVLLGESTNDASSDLQGDGWHGAMTYPSSPGRWGLAQRADHQRYVNAEGDEVPTVVLRAADRRNPALSPRREFVAAVTRFTSAIPWRVRLGNMQPLDTHDTAALRDPCRPGTIPLASCLSMTLPGLPVFRRRRVRRGRRRRRGEPDADAVGTEGEPETAARLSLYRDLIHLRRDHAAPGDRRTALGALWTTRPSSSFASRRTRRCSCSLSRATSTSSWAHAHGARRGGGGRPVRRRDPGHRLSDGSVCCRRTDPCSRRGRCRRRRAVDARMVGRCGGIRF